MEQFSNLAVTLLNGAIDDNDTSVVVDDVTAFPSSGDFRILIDNEYLLVTNVNSGTDTFTVTRGVENTIPVAHNDNSIVKSILTEGALRQIVKDNVNVGVYGSNNITTSLSPGRLYLPTDSDIVTIDNYDEDNDINSVLNFGPLRRMVPPVYPSFSWLNQGTCEVFTTGGLLHLKDLRTNGATNIRALYQDVGTPGLGLSTPYSVTSYIVPLWADIDFQTAGIGFMESGTGRLITIHLLHAFGEPYIEINKWTNYTTYSATYLRVMQYGLQAEPRYLKIENTGTNLRYYFSVDGFTFQQLLSTTLTDFFIVGPDRLLLFINVNMNSNSYGENVIEASFYTWEVN